MTTSRQASESIEFKASHIRAPNKDVVGGKLRINGEVLVFEPNSVAKKTANEEPFSVPLYDIESLKKESAGRGIIYSLTNGKLAGHLHIKLDDGSVHVFTVSSVDEKIEMLSPLIDSASKPVSNTDETTQQHETDHTEKYCTSCGEKVLENTDYCPSCGTAIDEYNQTQSSTDENETETSTDEKETKPSPRFPILSVFSSLMIFRTSFVLLENPRPDNVAGFVIFAVSATVIIPRVRLKVYDKILHQYGLNLKKRLWSIPIALIYSILVFISILLLLGEGGAIGFGSIIVAFVTAVVLVLFSRLISRIF